MIGHNHAGTPPAPLNRRAPLSIWNTQHARSAPMTSFDDREQAFEAKFAHDEDLKFRVLARRDKLVGLWAAGLLGKTGDEADAYAKQVILSDLEEPGDADIIRKLVADLAPVGIDEAAITAKLAEQAAEAARQLMEG
jgi:hypothetical protein